MSAVRGLDQQSLRGYCQGGAFEILLNNYFYGVHKLIFNWQSSVW